MRDSSRSQVLEISWKWLEFTRFCFCEQTKVSWIGFSSEYPKDSFQKRYDWVCHIFLNLCPGYVYCSGFSLVTMFFGLPFIGFILYCRYITRPWSPSQKKPPAIYSDQKKPPVETEFPQKVVVSNYSLRESGPQNGRNIEIKDLLKKTDLLTWSYMYHKNHPCPCRYIYHIWILWVGFPKLVVEDF